jgi:catechol 2,3-dioxygenase-like lactoylglutathione lyase family enzyme
VNDSQEVFLTKSSPAPDPAGLAEISFATDSLRRFDTYLVQQGIPIKRAKYPDAIEITDPDGHHLRFVERKRMTYGHKVRGMRLIHAGFIVRNRAATEHFYKDILGFRPYWHGGMKDDQTDWISLQVPDGTDWVELMVNVPENADQHLRGVMNHIALGVPDIQKAREQLVKNGVHLTEEPKLGRDGKWQLNLYDPDQTRIEFMEFTPKEKPCCSEFTGPHPKP